VGKKRKFCGPEIRCVVTGAFGADLHHVLTRGAGGSDHPKNLMPLRHELHEEVGMIGMVRFAQKYSLAKFWLLENGWEWSSQLCTWFAPPEAREPLKKIMPRKLI